MDLTISLGLQHPDHPVDATAGAIDLRQGVDLGHEGARDEPPEFGVFGLSHGSERKKSPRP